MLKLCTTYRALRNIKTSRAQLILILSITSKLWDRGNSQLLVSSLDYSISNASDVFESRRTIGGFPIKQRNRRRSNFTETR